MTQITIGSNKAQNNLHIRYVQSIIVISLSALSLLSCNTSPEKKDGSDIEMIRAARDLSNQAIARHDTAVLAAIWTVDYHIVTSRNFETSGRVANRERFAGEFSAKPDVLYVRTPDTIEIFSRWQMAAETGRWEGHWTENGERIELKGSYFAKWHKVGDQWLIRAEIFVPLSCSGGKYCEQTPI